MKQVLQETTMTHKQTIMRTKNSKKKKWIKTEQNTDCNEESEAVGSICSVLLRSVSKADRGSINSVKDITENQNHKRITRRGSGQAAGWHQDGIRINNQRGRRRRISRGKAVQDHTQNNGQSKRSEMSDGAKQDFALEESESVAYILGLMGNTWR